jgi:hypothetical protein
MRGWLRWLLILPVALLADWISQSCGLVVLKFLEVIWGHEDRTIYAWLGGRPFAEALIWHTWAPGWFVWAGAMVAPKHRFRVAVALAAIVAVVAVYNVQSWLRYALGSGSWSAVEPTTGAPAWWLMSTFVLGIIVVVLVALSFKERPAGVKK